MMECANNIRRLLVLDDEADVAATICMMAETADYDVAHTIEPSLFFEKLVSWAPSHVVVDLQLADRDGIEVINQLAKMNCQAVVIIVSGLGGRILDSAARAAAENGLRLAGALAKPFTRSALMSLLTSKTPDALSPEDDPSASPHNVTVEQLSSALEEGVFTAYFQPKIACPDGELMGFECLARWPQPDGSMIPPEVFIALAEREGFIHQLTRQVHNYALANFPDRARDAQLKIALNLSPTNLTDKTFPCWLWNKCKEYEVAPSQIILEVTETASMNNPLALLESLTQFRIRGFQLSIDDFGVGFSSLVQLARLPFSELKIDQMFVKTLLESEESRKIVSAVVSLGSSLGLNVVAEGVENSWALNFLRDIGCNEAQGYYIAPPLGSIAASRWQGLAGRAL